MTQADIPTPVLVAAVVLALAVFLFLFNPWLNNTRK